MKVRQYYFTGDLFYRDAQDKLNAWMRDHPDALPVMFRTEQDRKDAPKLYAVFEYGVDLDEGTH